MKKILTLILALTLILTFTACSGGTDDKTIVIGATPAPHAEILEFVKPILEKEGYTLEIKVFTDYVLPNNALNSKELDANFFQHKPYLDNFNEKNGADLVSAGVVHFEPLGVYPGRSTSLEELPDGAVIGVPNDPSNEARALKLLEANGIIKLKEGAGFEATAADIAENPHNIKVQEMEAAQVAISIQDLDFGVINGNYAISANLSDRVLVTEAIDSDSANEYVNIVAVRPGDESKPKIEALIKALNSEETRKFIEETYAGVCVPKF